MPQLLEISHVTKRGSSLAAAVPKKVAKLMSLNEGDFLGFYEEDGKIIVRGVK